MQPATRLRLVSSLLSGVDSGIPGLSAAIATRDGVIWTGVAGVADLHTSSAVCVDDMFGIGSITKLFVAVVILQLVEEGRLTLDATPRRILGDESLAGVANANSATIADLLGHVGGVPSWEDDPAWIREARGAGLDPDRIWGKTETLDYIRGHPATGPAGAIYAYSNTGYTLLGLIIEQITGQTLEAEVRRRILYPLKLEHTYFEGFERPASGRVSHRYHYATESFIATAGASPSFASAEGAVVDVTRSNLSVEWAAGGMLSSARDLAVFGRGLRDGQLVSRTSLSLMHQWRKTPAGTQVGHGLFRTELQHGAAIGHNGGVLGFTASLWWAEAGDVVVAILCNVGTMHAGADLPNAVSVALRSGFTDLVIDVANTIRE